MSDFSIAITDKGVVATINEFLEETDVIEMLKFNEGQIDNLLETHASIQVYWEAMAVRLKGRFEAFQNEWAKKWWAHNKMFAKYVLFAYGDPKPTVEALKDMTTIIYSQDATDTERDKYLDIAHQVAVSKKGTHVGDVEEFKKSMYKYLAFSPPWYFETIVQTSIKMREDYELVQTVASKLDSRSFHVHKLADLVEAKLSNLGPFSREARKVREEGQLMSQVSKGGNNVVPV